LTCCEGLFSCVKQHVFASARTNEAHSRVKQHVLVLQKPMRFVLTCQTCSVELLFMFPDQYVNKRLNSSFHHIKRSNLYRKLGLNRSIHMDYFYYLFMNFSHQSSTSC